MYYGDSYFAEDEEDYPFLRSAMSRRYRNVSSENVERVVRRTIGRIDPGELEDFLQTLADVGQVVLPVLGGAVGTFAGPVGTAVGGAAGTAAAGALGAAAKSSKKKSGRRKKKSVGAKQRSAAAPPPRPAPITGPAPTPQPAPT